MSDLPQLPADVCRCLGHDCAERGNCLRYLTRNDMRHAWLSFMERGHFVDGKCILILKAHEPTR